MQIGSKKAEEKTSLHDMASFEQNKAEKNPDCRSEEDKTDEQDGSLNAGREGGNGVDRLDTAGDKALGKRNSKQEASH